MPRPPKRGQESCEDVSNDGDPQQAWMPCCFGTLSVLTSYCLSFHSCKGREGREGADFSEEEDEA